MHPNSFWLIGIATAQAIWMIHSSYDFQKLIFDNSYNKNHNSNSDSNTINNKVQNEWNHPSATGNISIGQQIVETSYRTSGFEDIANVICPASTTEILPTRFRRDFGDKCLNRAKDMGNTPGSIYHDRWPWWFRTLLRDLTGGMDHGRQELFGDWHYLQFKGVGGTPAANDGGGGANDSSSVAGDGTNAAPRLQLCVYEKGGTKSWKKLQCQHNHNYEGKIPDFNQCWNKQPPYDETMAKKARIDNPNITIASVAAAYKSEKVVFLRDPLDRFLSGFLDKCVKDRTSNAHCAPYSVFTKDSQKRNVNDSGRSPIETMLSDDRQKFQAYVDTFPLTWNMHFFPQSFYCGGLYKTIDDYDFVGSMGKNFYTDLETMQKRYPGLKPGMESVFKLSKEPKKQSKNDGTNQGIETKAASQVLKYYTPHTVRRVLEYYAMDYVALGMPIPEWAEEMLLSS